MIRVRMGSDNIVQMIDSLIFQVCLYLGSFAVVACVNKHGVTALSDQGTIALADVQIMHLQGGSI